MSQNWEGHERLGHFLDDAVYSVFWHSDGYQYINIPEEGPLKDNYLRAGKTWRVGRGLEPVPPKQRPIYLRRAVHELGHAAACLLAGVKVEFVSVVTESGGSLPRLGYCCYDHDWRELQKRDLVYWNARLFLADLGGPLAEQIYVERHDLPIENEHRFSWAWDVGNATEWLGELGFDKARRHALVTPANQFMRLHFEAGWAGFVAAAEVLVSRWAIPGKEIGEPLSAFQPIDLAPLIQIVGQPTETHQDDPPCKAGTGRPGQVTRRSRTL